MKRRDFLAASAAATVSSSFLGCRQTDTREGLTIGMEQLVPRSLDHLVVGVSNLASGVDWITEVFGVRPVYGGRHPRLGTANYLLSLGPETYVELLGPDPDSESKTEPLLFGIETLVEPRLVTWAAKGSGLKELIAKANAQDVPLGQVRSGKRAQPDGEEIAWDFTDPMAFPSQGLVPFLIDWGSTKHPGMSSPAVGRLISLRAEHPDPASVRFMLSVLNLDLQVDQGSDPKLVARIQTLGGDEVEIF